LALQPLLIAVIGLILICSNGYAATERVVEFEYDGAGNIVRIITREQSDPPVISPLNPSFINQGQSRTITVNGSNLLGVEVSTDAPGLSIVAVDADESGISFQLTADSQAAIGNAIIRFTNGIGEVEQSIFVAEAGPVISTSPNPMTIGLSPPTNTVTLNFSEPRPENETYTLTTSNNSVADTVASSFTILAGQSQVDIALDGVAFGSTNLNIELTAKFFAYSFPVFVGKSYAELAAEFPDMLQRNLFAASVGVVLQDGTQFAPGTVSQVVGVVLQDGTHFVPGTVSQVVGVEVGRLSGITLDPVGVFYGDGLVGSLTARPVGVNVSDAVDLVYSPIVGAVYGTLFDALQPTMVATDSTVDSTVDLTVTGLNLNEVIDFTFTPDADITLEGFTVNPEGTQLTLTLTIDSLATLGQRTVSVQDGSGAVPTLSGQPLVIELQ
jgi:hypothetical protein